MYSSPSCFIIKRFTAVVFEEQMLALRNAIGSKKSHRETDRRNLRRDRILRDPLFTQRDDPMGRKVFDFRTQSTGSFHQSIHNSSTHQKSEAHASNQQIIRTKRR
ncbi:hypothetical protein NPIL_526201 [Nephila pilipes]|uniref:Uncharacterized protein n=1 Tax=Nephila pilipes TaxID=299642 RepID=A0A8X6U8P3_NEPPI|nr:hypothetical protein NPIL_526201 [Nephila pilipes]